MNVKTLGLILGPLFFWLIIQFFHPESLSKEANAILASTIWIAIWWITEAIPIAATALLPIVLFPLSGGLKINLTTAAYGHYLIFLYLGGFMLAIAIEKWDLHKRIALNIIKTIGTNVKYIILGFMLATAFMSMWISNTATSVMMLPIGLAIINQLKDNPASIENENLIFGKALMLGIAYSASIGGIATLIGTPPNLVLAANYKDFFGVEITFVQWIKFGLPIAVVLLLICWYYLTHMAFTFKQQSFPGGRAEIQRQIHKLGPRKYEENIVLIVFIITALCWITRKSILEKILPSINDTAIAISAGILLFILPTSNKAKKIITWQEAVKMPWGVILLFGGGMAIASGFKESGLALWIGSQLSYLQGITLILLVLILIAAVNFLTEITSNLATTSMLMPILAPMALTIDVHPYILMVGATVAASCAFMLPVATPPNAVVFGSGYLRIPDMVKTGIWMNIFSILLLTLMVYFLLPLLWSFDGTIYPKNLIFNGQ